MEQSNIKEFERITRIAHSKIPVSEESSVFNFFVARREVCRKFNSEITGDNLKLLQDRLGYIEENIKLYLCL